MIFLYVIIVLGISTLAAYKFDRIAKEKGHEGYFWWVFWLGLVGWIMVAALPDRSGGTGSFGGAVKPDELPDL